MAGGTRALGWSKKHIIGDKTIINGVIRLCAGPFIISLITDQARVADCDSKYLVLAPSILLLIT